MILLLPTLSYEENEFIWCKLEKKNEDDIVLYVTKHMPFFNCTFSRTMTEVRGEILERKRRLTNSIDPHL